MFLHIKKEKLKDCQLINNRTYKCLNYNNTSISNVIYLISKKVNIRYKQQKNSYKRIGSLLINYNTNSTYRSELIYFKNFGFKDVIISSDGIIHSKCWTITTEGGCLCDNIIKITLNANYKIYDKVVSITHHWGKAVFHSIVECLTKLGYYLNELLNDNSIIIHTSKSASINYLHFLGFKDSRIVYGNIHAKRLIVLEKGGCGSTPSVIHLIYLRNYLRKKIKSKHLYDIVIIKRYGKRDFLNFDDVYKTISNIYNKKKIIIFYPNTSFLHTLNYFKYAKIIVAPHGAGLSNTIVSYNCTVIEYLIKNLCYASLSVKLGLKYYGIYERLIDDKFIVNITILKCLLRKYMS